MSNKYLDTNYTKIRFKKKLEIDLDDKFLINYKDNNIS